MTKVPDSLEEKLYIVYKWVFCKLIYCGGGATSESSLVRKVGVKRAPQRYRSIWS